MDEGLQDLCCCPVAKHGCIVLAMQAPPGTPGEWPWQAIATVVAAVIAAIAAGAVAYIQNKRHKDVDAKLDQLETGRQQLAEDKRDRKSVV